MPISRKQPNTKTIYVSNSPTPAHYGFRWSKRAQPGFFPARVVSEAPPGYWNTFDLATDKVHTTVKIAAEIK